MSAFRIPVDRRAHELVLKTERNCAGIRNALQSGDDRYPVDEALGDALAQLAELRKRTDPEPPKKAKPKQQHIFTFAEFDDSREPTGRVLFQVSEGVNAEHEVYRVTIDALSARLVIRSLEAALKVAE